MPIARLTGTQDSRIAEIQQRHLVFEPTTSEDMYQNVLYTVPLGQTFGAEILAETGSFTLISGAIKIQKIIHLYENENEANAFINQIGEKNIASIIKKPFLRENGSTFYKTEVHMINHPQVRIPVGLLNSEVKRGFKVEIFMSSSNGLQEIDDDPVYNTRGQLVSDTYLKYFEVKNDA